ncbi:MAG: 50S ribosomal protein L30 [Rickettsiales bacterium]|jgi:ribosomal protein L30|nr:50S ribosomal protein L30 [Rickettsiales bacterium]
MIVNFNDLKDGDSIKVKQIKGHGGYSKTQRDTIVGLGLKGVNTIAIVKVTRSTVGMLKMVRHLLLICE